VVAGVEAHDVVEQPLAQHGLGETALAEGVPPAPCREQSGDHAHSGEQRHPLHQRATAQHGSVDGPSGECRHDDLAEAPQHADEHARRKSTALRPQRLAQQAPPASGAGAGTVAG
jgi:hypothetical protein